MSKTGVTRDLCRIIQATTYESLGGECIDRVKQAIKDGVAVAVAGCRFPQVAISVEHMRSAGADPGLVCYGRGGTEPTVTDANVALGRINPDYFAGGEARLDRSRAIAAIEEKIARPLGLSVTDAAAGIISVVNAHMVRILRVVSVARGRETSRRARRAHAPRRKTSGRYAFGRPGAS